MGIYVFGSGAVSARSGYPGYLIDGRVLMDCPPGCVKKMLRMGADLCGITDVLVTHFHGDHYFDLPFLLLARYRKTEQPLRIHCPEEGRRILPQLLSLAYPDIPLETVPVTLNHGDRFQAGAYGAERLPRWTRPGASPGPGGRGCRPAPPRCAPRCPWDRRSRGWGCPGG